MLEMEGVPFFRLIPAEIIAQLVELHRQKEIVKYEKRTVLSRLYIVQTDTMNGDQS